MAITLAFLPNAPYVVTDLAHLRRDVSLVDDWAFSTLVYGPLSQRIGRRG